MSKILLFSGLGILVCAFYICYRLHNFYNEQHPTKKQYLENGFWVIIWAVILVGISGMFSNELGNTHSSQTEFSYTSSLIESFSDLLQYIAPLVFAAIGVNLVCYALITKEDLGEMYEKSQLELKNANTELDALKKKTKTLNAKIRKLEQEKVKKENVINVID
ncbi:hypothetical protein ACFKIW_004654 [Vibrio alginolyticus]